MPDTWMATKVMTTSVNRLHPGDAFRVELGGSDHIDYRLLYVNQCRAYVEPLKKRAEIDILENSPGGRVSIAPNCECEMIDEELEIMMKSAPTTTTTKTTTPAKAVKAARAPRGTGNRAKREPRKQERPIREGTIRAKLLSAIEGGNVSVPKLMKQLDMTRPVLFAHINEFWRAHGYGYSITDDIVKLVKPVGGAMKLTPAGMRPPKPVKKASKKVVAADLFDDEDEDPLA